MDRWDGRQLTLEIVSSEYTLPHDTPSQSGSRVSFLSFSKHLVTATLHTTFLPSRAIVSCIYFYGVSAQGGLSLFLPETTEMIFAHVN